MNDGASLAKEHHFQATRLQSVYQKIQKIYHSQRQDSRKIDLQRDHLEPEVFFQNLSLPIEYFGGESGRYFEVGSPELESCTTPYGLNHPTSHGVVLDAPDGSQIDAQGLWMGPQLASGPGGTGQTGGAKKRKRKRRTKKRKN